MKNESGPEPSEAVEAKEKRHVYSLNAGPPWVIAASAEEAHAILCDGDARGESVDIGFVSQMPDDEPFTMFYSDPFEDEPVLADEEPCGYYCEDFHNHTEMTCADWAECGWGFDGPVIWEFEG